MLMVSVCLVLPVVGCGGSPSGDVTTSETVIEGKKPKIEVPKGPPPTKLIVKDLVKGHGPPVKAGDELTVQYVALRWSGEPFQSSWDTGRPDPFTFKLHSHVVIPGWERGLSGMQVGGRRELVIPPQLIYYPGAHTESKLLPEDSLVYVVDLLDLR
jgi:FKBP-type peptidyl-prolyl cis-trans isomerase